MTMKSINGDVLLVIDMQNDFVLPESALCVKGGMEVIPFVQRAVDSARMAGVPVIWVCREHHRSGVDVEQSRKHHFELGKPGICTTGTHGAEVVKPLSVGDGDLYLVKKRWSAFFGTSLDVTLKRLGVSQVVIAGVQTPNCIRQTAFDAISNDYSAVVLRDATGAASYEVHEANLLDMKNAGVGITSTHDWAVSLALKAVTPGALGTLMGVGLAQGVNAAGAGMNQAVTGIANFFSGAGAAFGGGGAGGGGGGGGESPGSGGKSAGEGGRDERGGTAGGTPDKTGGKRGTDSGPAGEVEKGSSGGGPPSASPSSG